MGKFKFGALVISPMVQLILTVVIALSAAFIFTQMNKVKDGTPGSDGSPGPQGPKGSDDFSYVKISNRSDEDIDVRFYEIVSGWNTLTSIQAKSATTLTIKNGNYKITFTIGVSDRSRFDMKNFPETGNNINKNTTIILYPDISSSTGKITPTIT